jgi:regulator of PEP synthase PpsR (kinase-PPPase family)
MMSRRTVFFVSDHTGVTVETLGHSLLAQFEGIEFRQVTVPFVDSVDKAAKVAAKINQTVEEEGLRPIVFASLVKDDVRAVIMDCDALTLDFFEAFLGPLEVELAIRSLHAYRRLQGVSDSKTYNNRIEATNFALATDDGHGPHLYGDADVILVGVSRSGKTPTCLYLALQYGVFAANFPFAEDDFESSRLPGPLEAHRKKLYGLTISPERLRSIRLERRSMGRYASSQQISFELRAAEALFTRFGIPFIDTSHSSIEEIASTILNETGLERRARGY